MSLLPHRTLHVCHRTAAWWHMQMPAVDMWVQLETVDINYDGHQDVLMVSSTGVSNSECIHEHPEWAAQWLSMGQSWDLYAFDAATEPVHYWSRHSHAYWCGVGTSAGLNPALQLAVQERAYVQHPCKYPCNTQCLQ